MSRAVNMMLRRNGFSFIEVLVVMGIFGAMLAFAIPSVVQTTRYTEGERFVEMLSADLYLAANEALSNRGRVRITFQSWNGVYTVQRMWEVYRKNVSIPTGFVVFNNFSGGMITFNELGHVLQGGTVSIVYPNGVTKKVTIYMASGRFAVSSD